MASVANTPKRHKRIALARSAGRDASMVLPTQIVPKRRRLIGDAEGLTLMLSPLSLVIKEIPYETFCSGPDIRRSGLCRRSSRSPRDTRRYCPRRCLEVLENQPC